MSQEESGNVLYQEIYIECNSKIHYTLKGERMLNDIIKKNDHKL